jgi:hypothetical protein
MEVIEYKPEKSSCAPKGINPHEVFALKTLGFKPEEIAEKEKCSSANIRRILKDYEIIAEKVEDFKSVEGILQNGLKSNIVAILAKCKVSPNNATEYKNLAIAYEKLYHCGRLQEEKSTANISVKIEDISPDHAEHLRRIVKDLYR